MHALKIVQTLQHLQTLGFQTLCKIRGSGRYNLKVLRSINGLEQ